MHLLANGGNYQTTPGLAETCTALQVKTMTLHQRTVDGLMPPSYATMV